MADERARLVSGCARAGGDAGPASWAMHVKGQARLVRKAEQAWAAAAPSSFLFPSLLFVANLVRVYHK